ncbi:L-dopachrome tautomerase-related protein [Serratia sp. M24T3]|uniref:L-dopachrome tautomerase-related protein n=1 Tax=Serratia sp. M24T3 TaxID=932213 RepID=UPI00025BA516|nr:L-dopachrome tautomerase-related protein [Serratia sp. M24T3]EIC82663.1 glyoxalase/bleomycin resistance protein/dioxygenase [Serratia sp. M24T3]
MNRRDFFKASLLTTGSMALLGTNLAQAFAATDYGLSKGLGSELKQVASLRWLSNAIAVTSTGRNFVGLPRWPTNEKTPSVAELLPDGTLKPFPGGSWNEWQPGQPGDDAFVLINTVHIFDDDTLWVVDQGDPKLDRKAQKILQFDTKTGKLLKKITFDEHVLPKGGNINDLRLDSKYAYFTDSGLGGIIYTDLESGKSWRRLGNHPSIKAKLERPAMDETGTVLQKDDGSPKVVNSDPIELSPDGKWLYYQTLSGPMYRVPTASLRDEKLSEQALGQQVEFVYDTPALSGTAIDNKGNIYMAEAQRPRVIMLTPDGDLKVIVEDDRIWGPDALFISHQRELYIPCPQTARLAYNRGPGGKDLVQRPYKIYKVKLPDYAGDREPVPPVSHKA